MPRKKLEKVEPQPTLPEPQPDKARAALARVAGRMGAWRPARQVLRSVRAVPTIFPWLDYATRVGGFPVERISVVHGPSAEGKTEFLLGLGLSFLRRRHFFFHVDAEKTTPYPWVDGLFAEYAANPCYLALRPKSYEETADAVRQGCKQLIAAKKTGELPPDTSALFGVDSLRKLVPENFLAKIEKYGAQGQKGSVDGMSGMGAAIKAKMNADWFDELTGLLHESGAAMLIVARESENREKGNGVPDWKLTGGRAVLFEGSLMIRIERDWERVGSGPESEVVGERHDCSIYKSKVAGKDDKEEVFSFWTSNGKLTPEGFDPARDFFELGVVLGVVRQSGGWFAFRQVKWQGKSQAVKRLAADGALRGELEKQVRGKFAETAVGPAHDAVTGEVLA
jgi:RecA/RadA recombinase